MQADAGTAAGPAAAATAEPAAARAHLPALDVLRGVAILAVIWHHLAGFRLSPAWWLDTAPPLAWAGSLAGHGWMGVSLFFVLSGFVLYRPYASGQRRFAGRADVLAFYRRRAGRLLPLYGFGLVVLIGLGAQVDVRTLVALATFTFNFHPTTYFPAVNWVLWSLGLEIWFSLLFPLLVLGMQRYGLRLAALAVVALALGTRVVGLQVPQAHYLGDPSLNIVVHSVIGRLDEFFLGMVLAAWHARGGRSRLQAVPLLLMGVAAALGAALLHDLLAAGHLDGALRAVASYPVQLAAALLVVGALSLRRGRCWPLELAGLMCYSLYFWHGVLLNHTVHAQGGAAAAGPATLAGFFAILGAVGWGSYRYVENRRVADWRALLPQPAMAAAAATRQAERSASGRVAR